MSRLAVVGLLTLVLVGSSFLVAAPPPPAAAPAVEAGPLKIALPLGRTVYQTNETIDLAVVRTRDALKAGKLTLSLKSTDGSDMSFVFPVTAGAGSQTEHLHLDGRLLRPGHYTIAVVCDDARAEQEIDLISHVRKTSYALVTWGRAVKDERLLQGEDSFGFNLIYGHYTNDNDATYMRGGVDFMSCCRMSGAHQMDMRSECDWSDSYVTRGGTARVVQDALQKRTRGNVYGVHFYDEPGLTWVKNERTNETTPHMIPAQVRAYVSAFGREPLWYSDVDPKNPEHVAQWTQWATWKLSFMESAWKEAAFGVTYVRPDYLPLNQSQYGCTAFTDGYYFNIARQLPITSGHGGYDDFGWGYFNPSWTLEFARARDLVNPCWYLPTWYGSTHSDRFRLEQYLSFQTGIQGMITPPDLEPAKNATGRAGIVESNKIFARIGTVMQVSEPNRTPLALLYSMSDTINWQLQDIRNNNYAHAGRHVGNLGWTYLATKLIQQPAQFVVDEDVIDGTLAANHKAVIVTGVDYLAPKVIAGLEQFAAQGGLVLVNDTKVMIAGAVAYEGKGGLANEGTVKELADQIKAAKGDKARLEQLGLQMQKINNVGEQMKGSMAMAAAIKAQLDKAGIKPVLTTDNPQIIATRQGDGDIEYVIAVNASFDYEKGRQNDPRAADANITLAAAGRPIYDAVLGMPAAELTDGKGLVRFGPGQMKVWALTREPIQSVKLGGVTVTKDFTRKADPIRLELSAALLGKSGLLGGPAPMQVTVLDALGQVRYDVYRGAKGGVLNLTLPLAANDPAGTWTVIAKDLLAGTTDQRTFEYKPAASCSAIAGATSRAVFFQDDWNNVFRFARVARTATIVYGSSEYNKAAAERIAQVLEPWDVKCTLMTAEEANKPRQLTPEQAKTWISWAGGTKKVADVTTSSAGFAIQGHVILVGTPEDNPLIALGQKNGFLPYAAGKEFPGTARGYMSWQRELIGKGQESVTLIAYDEKGMAEAVGTMYEAVHGLDPLTKYTLPESSQLAAANKVTQAPRMKIAWEAAATDRVVAVSADEIFCADNSVCTVTADGKVTRKAVDAVAVATARETPVGEVAMAAAKKVNAPDRMLKTACRFGDLTAVAYWGGTIKLVDAEGQVKAQAQLSDDIGGMTVIGDKLIVGTSSGKIVALTK